MIYITAIHLTGGYEHQHISSLRWRNPGTGSTGESTRQAVVDWIDEGNTAKVQGQPDALVGVVRPQQGPPYLRTYADGTWTNNLLSLPTY